MARSTMHHLSLSGCFDSRDYSVLGGQQYHRQTRRRNCREYHSYYRPCGSVPASRPVSAAATVEQWPDASAFYRSLSAEHIGSAWFEMSCGRLRTQKEHSALDGQVEFISRRRRHECNRASEACCSDYSSRPLLSRQSGDRRSENVEIRERLFRASGLVVTIRTRPPLSVFAN